MKISTGGIMRQLAAYRENCRRMQPLSACSGGLNSHAAVWRICRSSICSWQKAASALALRAAAASARHQARP